jgi:FixJ family two-component response regulator
MKSVVSAVRNWIRSMAEEGPVPTPGAPEESGQASALMPVLLASERDDDHQTLQALLQNTRWTVARALSWGDAASFCGRVIKPVILVDRYFQGSDWRFTVSSMVNLESNSCLILLSDVSDQYLWNEVVQHGGFDVLARPFQRSEVLRTLEFAQRHSGTPWPPLHSPEENGGSPA